MLPGGISEPALGNSYKTMFGECFEEIIERMRKERPGEFFFFFEKSLEVFLNKLDYSLKKKLGRFKDRSKRKNF